MNHRRTRGPALHIVVAIFVLGCLTGRLHARPVMNWTDEKLTADADLVVMATATSSKDEDADRSNAKPDSWVGVNTVFTPLAVLKGKLEAKSFTIRHDRYFDPKMSMEIIDGPGFVEFDVTGGTKYLLFLKKLDDGRYEAASGRMDPHFSVKVLQSYSDPVHAAAPKVSDQPVPATRPSTQAISPASGRAGDFETLDHIPSPEEVIEGRFDSRQSVVSKGSDLPESFKKALATAKPLDASDKSLRTWSYSPSEWGTFKTKDGTYKFTLYLGERGQLTTPSGKVGMFTYEGTATLPPEVEAGLVKLADPKVLFIESTFFPTLKDLGRGQRAAVMARVTKALGSEHLEVRRRAALLLGDLGDWSGVPVMMKDYATKDANDRGNVVVALRVLKDKRAVPTLVQAMDDPSPHIRCIAIEALGELKAVEAYDKIVAHLKDKEEPNNTDVHGMTPATSACYAVGAMGDRLALPVLVKALDDPDLAPSAAQALAVLTKTGEGWDAERWKAWWSAQMRESGSP